MPAVLIRNMTVAFALSVASLAQRFADRRRAGQAIRRSIPRPASLPRRPMMPTRRSPPAAPLIDNEKTPKADRIKALIARAGAYRAQGQIDRAIADYDVALRIDPTLADIFNARGELWRRKGDRPARWPISPPRSS